MTRALIFVNGNLPDLAAARRLIQPGDLILAADGGARHALALGLVPSCIIGDLDSLAEEEAKQAVARRSLLLSYPPDKDETDLELALDYALERGCHQIRIVAALGGRLDQTLANLALLTAPRLAERDARLDDGLEEAFFIRQHAAISGAPGDIVSLLPWGAAAEGIVTEGLRWPLRGETLFPERTRGVSNEMLTAQASVRVAQGMLLCVHRRRSFPEAPASG